MTTFEYEYVESKMVKSIDYLGNILNIIMISFLHLLMFGIADLTLYTGINEMNLFYIALSIFILLSSIWALLISIRYKFFLNQNGGYF